ncbi:MAG: nodulation protein NfeD [Actinomycetota bacterium]
MDRLGCRGLRVLMIAVGLAVAALLAPATGSSAEPVATTLSDPPSVRLVRLSGVVDPLVANSVTRAIEASSGSQFVLLELDTPGGMDGAMRDIVKAILDAPVPVVGFVAPSGARAASAGTFILLACDLAAMAPGTNVGAAHPVGISGDVLAEKVTNDAAAYIRSIAQARGRNADWAESAVREAVAVSAEEAVRLNVADLVAADRADLLAQLEGREVGGAILHPAGSRIQDASPSGAVDFLHRLISPDIAFLLLLLGIVGIAAEVTHPGVTVPGVVGVLALILALIELQMLPVRVGALALILAAVVLFILDLKVAGHAFLSMFGTGALLVGGFLLFDRSSMSVHVNPGVLIGSVLAFTAFFTFALSAVLRARHGPVLAGAEALAGIEGVATSDLAPNGFVRARGETWPAIAEGGRIPKGGRVRVVRLEGLHLRVRVGSPEGNTQQGALAETQQGSQQGEVVGGPSEGDAEGDATNSNRDGGAQGE